MNFNTICQFLINVIDMVVTIIQYGSVALAIQALKNHTPIRHLKSRNSASNPLNKWILTTVQLLKFLKIWTISSVISIRLK